MKNNPSEPGKEGLMENNLSESVIGSLPGLFYLYDDTGKFIHWNRNFEVVSGYTGEEISRMHPIQFFDEPEKEILAEKIAEVFEKGQAYIEACFFTKNKKRIPYYFNGFSIQYQNKRCLIGVGIDITERVEAEKKRAESEGQFKALFENSMDGILLTRPDGVVLHANPAACSMFRRTEKEIQAVGRQGLVDPGDSRLGVLLEERNKAGKAIGELLFVRKDGEKFPAEITTSVFKGQGGEDRTSMIIRDVVHLKKTEASLRKLNRELYLLNNANKVIFKAAEEDTLLEDLCNLLVEEGNYIMCWIGYVPEKENPEQLVTPHRMAGAGKERAGEIILNLKDADQIKGPAARAILHAKPVVVNHIAAEPGHKRWKDAAAEYGFASSVSFPLIIDNRVSVSLNIYSSNAFSFDEEEINMLRTIADNLCYAIAGIRNTRNKELVEKKLNYNEENLRLIFASTHDIIFMLSLEPPNRYKFISVNDAFLLVTGLKPEQVFNRYLDEVIPPQSLPIVLEKYDAAIRSKAPMKWEEISEYPSGTKTGIVTITPVSDENGHFNRLVGFVHDITEHKQAEEDMDRMNTQLRSLSNYMQTMSEMERTSIAREIHDVLGQQMTALKYDIAWLKKRKGSDNEINDRVESMNHLVDETMVSIRKVSSELRPKILDDLGLNAAIEWFVTQFEKNTGIKCIVDSELEDMVFEKPVSITIYRILQEALTNVARHSKASRVEIYARVEAGRIVLEICDNGKGITPAEMKKPTSYGLLGMTERAKMIGGEVMIQGKPDKGTRVILLLPVTTN
jgi:PAS domain S-box-containing protein